jgi:hypothetical protein
MESRRLSDVHEAVRRRNTDANNSMREGRRNEGLFSQAMRASAEANRQREPHEMQHTAMPGVLENW